MISADKRFDVAYDHYKDTFVYIKRYCRQRDRLFLYVLGLLAVFELNPAAGSTSILQAILKKSTGADITLGASLVTTLSWVLLLLLVTKYYQSNITIDLQYKILHAQEEGICNLFGSRFFVRERSGYLSSAYGTKFSKFVSWLYRWLFPLLIPTAAVHHLAGEMPYWDGFPQNISLDLVLSSGACLALLVLTFVYLLGIHCEIPKAKAAEQPVPFV